VHGDNCGEFLGLQKRLEIRIYPVVLLARLHADVGSAAGYLVCAVADREMPLG